MKLSRRCFLSFAIGGAAGTALSPLPWKLTDDLSIWSQNWPWTPVPPDGKATYVDSTCTLCSGNCGIRVRKIDGRAVKIEGQEGTALNRNGGLCLLGMSGLQLLYGPTRVQGPLKRVDDQWKSISWKEAIEEVSEKLKTVRDRGNPQSVACLVPKETGTVSQLFKRLMTAYGSPNFICMPSVQDANDAALALTRGTGGNLGLDVENADFILSFGSALLDGYGSPLRMMQAVGRLKDQHGTLVQVEPCLSNTAAKANIWIPAKPGTEADLALAMAYAIIAEGKFDADFIEDSIEGFQAFTAMLKDNYSPDMVAQKCGVKAETIIKTALAFASADKPLAIYGRGKGQTPGSLKEALAVDALNILVGNINRPGGAQSLPVYDYINWPESQIDNVAAAGIQTTRIDGAGSSTAPYASHLVHRFVDAVQSAAADLQVLLVGETNPCYSLPHAAKVKEAFSKIPFVVSFSSFMDETAAQADMILPSHLYLERYEDVPLQAGAASLMVGLCRPVVKPLYHTRHIGDSIIQIAKSLKGAVAESFPWADYSACLQETLAAQWTTLRKQGVWHLEASIDQDLNTPSGKISLMDSTLKVIYEKESPAIKSDLLLVPSDSIRLSSRYIGTSPFMMKIVSDTVLKGSDGFVHINPKTAARLGLKEGDAAKITTKVGFANVRVHLDNGVMPDIVTMPRGLGHTAYDGFLAGKGVNINTIIGPVEDPASGLDAACAVPAELTKA